MVGASLCVLVVLGQVLGDDSQSDFTSPLRVPSLIGWTAGVLACGLALRFALNCRAWSGRRLSALLLFSLVIVELMGANSFLALNRATAPGALTSIRPAVAHLLGEASADATNPPARLLSISDILFDPGDKDDIELALRPQLPTDAVYDYVIATKQKEVLVPNLPLYYRLPTADGYDGGVLPLRHYVTLGRLFLPEGRDATDGRLRENLDDIPESRWLSLFNIRYVIADKVKDAWFDGVFYDLQFSAHLGVGDVAVVGSVPAVSATAVGVVYEATGMGGGEHLATVEVTLAGGETIPLVLAADAPGSGTQATQLSWEQPMPVSGIEVHGVWPAGRVLVRGLSLIDERTGSFWPLVLSDQGRYRLVHSGDVKIYENLEVLPRLFFVPRAIVVPDDESALTVMRDPGFDPATAVVLVKDGSLVGASNRAGQAAQPSLDRTTEVAAAAGPTVELLLYEPEHIVAAVSAPSEGWLVLSDAWYPGWEAIVDGAKASVERADVLFRAVAVPEGRHQLEWVYRPGSFRLGLILSLGALAFSTMLAAWAGLGRKQAAGTRS